MGLLGELSITHFVRGVIADSRSLGGHLESIRLPAVEDHRRTLRKKHHFGIGDPVWRRDDDLVAGDRASP